MGLIRKEDFHESFWLEGISNPNLLINGDFQVWQRGTNIGDIYNQYSADRWYVSKTSGTHSFEKTDKGMKVITNGETYVQQYIENSSQLKNTLITFTVSIDDIKYSITGKPIDGIFLDITNGNIRIDYAESKNLIVALIKINNTISIINWAKLEIGDHQTQFVSRPYGEELALCQRYYECSTHILRGIIGSELTRLSFDVPYKQTKRIAPTLKIYGLNNEEGVVVGKIGTSINFPILVYQNNVYGFGCLDIADSKGQSFVTGELFEIHGWEANAEIY